jgi:ectoine hydroxylase-related dioxygenase (phytanoyl-CoA dioxygenase family)
LSNEHHINAIIERGFTILPNLLTAEQVNSVRDALEPWLQQRLMGRNNFEGTRSERVYALLAKAPMLAMVVEHPAILALADHFLAPNYLLSANLAINVHPGETPQPFHADHASVPNCNRTELNGLSAIWAFDDFTEENGATEVIPGSHQSEAQQPSEAKLEKVVMSAGSAMVMHGSLYHRGGANHADQARLAITPQYCQPWLRQLENMVLSVPPNLAAGFSARVQEMLGYSIREPGFMGYVDGVHPKRLLDTDYRGRKERGLPS